MMNYKAFWNELTDAQQKILAMARDGTILYPVDDLSTQTAFSGLYLVDLLQIAYGSGYAITLLGRTVYDAGQVKVYDV
jgi:hypothetical protein